jgi:pyruvate/2-oxoglutarate dehydrogenase complex dihydrolipoamide acyltransferase (E2) component
MAEAIILPKFGWTMTEGTIVRWHRAEGEPIQEGEVLLEITTDKCVMDVESTASGIVLKILAQVDETRPIADVIAIVGEKDEDITSLLHQAGA